MTLQVLGVVRSPEDRRCSGAAYARDGLESER
jgi:hypothetical protein